MSLSEISQPNKDAILGLEQSNNHRIAGHIWKCAFTRLPIDRSRNILAEVFLWGCQTTQRRCGVKPNSPKFIVEAGLVLNRRATKVLGWQLKMKDGSSEFMRYSSTPGNPRKPGEIFLTPVVKGKKAVNLNARRGTK